MKNSDGGSSPSGSAKLHPPNSTASLTQYPRNRRFRAMSDAGERVTINTMDQEYTEGYTAEHPVRLTIMKSSATSAADVRQDLLL